MEQIPRAALAYHEHPYPPPNIKLSKSYQYDVENNNPRLFKWYFYLLETFYIKSVVARISCKIILQLPHSCDPTLPKAPWQVLSHFRPELFKPYPKLQPNVEERIAQVLDEFQQFNQSCRKDWSPLQAYTLDLFYLFYRINMYFIRDSVRNPDGRNHPFSLYKHHSPTELDLTNVDNVLRVHKAIPESIQLLDRTYSHLVNPVNYYEQTDFLPRGIIISAVDSAAQVLMYAYRLEASDQLRQHIELAEAILNIPIIWGDWGTSELLKTVIRNFLDANPVLSKKSSKAEPSLSPNGSVSTHEENDASVFDGGVDLNDDSTDLMTSFLPPTHLAAAAAYTTQPPAPPSTSNFIMTPWLTGQEPWMQDINQSLSTSDLLSTMPFVDPFQPPYAPPPPPQQAQPQQASQQAQQEQHQYQFVNDILNGLF